MDDLPQGFNLGENYEIQERIGKGGMGIVYLARQVTLDRQVAIKVLPAELCLDHEYVDRFLREARAAAHLNHPNIIHIFDAGVFENIYFFVMEYIDGSNLGQQLREFGRFTEQEALYAIQQSALGLAFAHHMGVVHRDVKPENIMVTRESAVKIGDLGLAKWKPNEIDNTLTAAGTTMGTPYYISPEQIRGLKDIDSRADIYSLGMTLYHILAGRPAFSTGSGPEIMAQHLSEDMPPLEQFAPDISARTIALVNSMTVKKREDRIQDMSAVADQLADMLGMEKPNTTRDARNKPEPKKPADLLEKIIHFIPSILIGLFLALVILMVWKRLHPTKTTPAPQENATSVTPPPPAPAPVVTKPPPLVEHAVAAEEKPAAPVIEKPAPIEEHKPVVEASMSPPPEVKYVPEPAPEPTVTVARQVPAPDRKIFVRSPKFIREHPINSKPQDLEAMKKTDASDPQIILNHLQLWVGHGGPHADAKVLIRADFLDNPEIGEKFLRMAKKARSVDLELTVVETSDFKDELELEIHSLLKPWLPSTNDYDALQNKYYELIRTNMNMRRSRFNPLWDFILANARETNWKTASQSLGERWQLEGASRGTADRVPQALLNADDPSQQERSFRIAKGSIGKVLHASIREEFLEMLEKVSNKEEVENYGWVVSVKKGTGEIRLGSGKVFRFDQREGAGIQGPGFKLVMPSGPGETPTH